MPRVKVRSTPYQWKPFMNCVPTTRHVRRNQIFVFTHWPCKCWSVSKLEEVPDSPIGSVAPVQIKIPRLFQGILMPGHNIVRASLRRLNHWRCYREKVIESHAAGYRPALHYSDAYASHSVPRLPQAWDRAILAKIWTGIRGIQGLRCMAWTVSVPRWWQSGDGLIGSTA